MRKTSKTYKPDRTAINQNNSNKRATAIVKDVMNTLNKLPVVDCSNILADFGFDSKGNICSLHLEIDQD